MAGWSTASDIWSVGCTIIELLSTKPPYFDLAPMAALFRIVQDDHPPLPNRISPVGYGFACVRAVVLCSNLTCGLNIAMPVGKPA